MKAGKPEPVAIIFFSNGTACVADQYGKQMGDFQVGNHKDTIKALADAGYDWRELDITGRPLDRFEMI